MSIWISGFWHFDNWFLFVKYSEDWKGAEEQTNEAWNEEELLSKFVPV